MTGEDRVVVYFPDSNFIEIDGDLRKSYQGGNSFAYKDGIKKVKSVFSQDMIRELQEKGCGVVKNW